MDFRFYKNEKNSPVVIIVTFFGMLTRYLIVNVVYILIGKKPKKLLDYSKGFQQILFNILVIFALFFGILFVNLYFESKAMHSK